MSLRILNEALVRLECLRTADDKGPTIVTLPEGAWRKVFYEAGVNMIKHSEECGNGGIVALYKPPDGEEWATGFWFYGCWVKSHKGTP